MSKYKRRVDSWGVSEMWGGNVDFGVVNPVGVSTWVWGIQSTFGGEIQTGVDSCGVNIEGMGHKLFGRGKG